MGKKRIALSAAIIALSAAAAQASDDAPRPIGTVTVELDLSNGDTKQLIANGVKVVALFMWTGSVLPSPAGMPLLI